MVGFLNLNKFDKWHNWQLTYTVKEKPVFDKWHNWQLTYTVREKTVLKLQAFLKIAWQL